jgi:radical SAM protein with 4Fe4S-binding SPASM domain
VVAAVVTKYNCEKLPELARRLISMGVSHFRVLRLMVHSKEMLKMIPPFEMLRKTVEKLEKIEKETGVEIAVHASPGFIEMTKGRKQYEIVHPMCHTCSAGKIAMGIFSDGTVTPCLELRDKKFECGNILSDSIKDIWNSKVMRYHREITPEDYAGKCGKCKSKWSCYSARCSAYSIYNDFLADDATCYLLSKS